MGPEEVDRRLERLEHAVKELQGLRVLCERSGDAPPWQVLVDQQTLSELAQRVQFLECASHDRALRTPGGVAARPNIRPPPLANAHLQSASPGVNRPVCRPLPLTNCAAAEGDRESEPEGDDVGEDETSPFSESIWDTALFVGLPGLGAACSAWAALLLLVNALVLTIYVWIVITVPCGKPCSMPARSCTHMHAHRLCAGTHTHAFAHVCARVHV